MKKKTEVTRANATEGQRRCLDVLEHCRFRTDCYDFAGGVETNVPDNLSTYDFDFLTRIVVVAHDLCVRVSVLPSGPGRLKLRLFARKRDGDLYTRHPTMEEAVNGVRERTGVVAV